MWIVPHYKVLVAHGVEWYYKIYYSVGQCLISIAKNCITLAIVAFRFLKYDGITPGQEM